MNEVLPGSWRGARCGGPWTDRFGGCQKRRYNAFTLVELLVVVFIIVILTGLVLSTVGYARIKSAQARAGTEIAAISAACENYKSDTGIYPRDNTTNQYTDALNARQDFDSTKTVYRNPSFYLYTQLSGDGSGNRNPTLKSYMAFKPNMLFPADQTQNVQYIQDPFGNSYGYSTANQADAAKGFNPTFDLWSTAGGTTNNDISKWIKNW
jgi:type II secretory pathway pseudopilin PulG